MPRSPVFRPRGAARLPAALRSGRSRPAPADRPTVPPRLHPALHDHRAPRPDAPQRSAALRRALATGAAALLIALPMALSPAGAQTVTTATPATTAETTTATAAPTLDEVRAALERARRAHPQAYPDLPQWRQAITLADRAVAADASPAALALRARVLSEANWPGPAWSAWQRALAAGWTPAGDELALAREDGLAVAFAAYDRGETAAALAAYEAVAALDGASVEAHVWRGRLLLELNRPGAAEAAWERVLELDPSDARAEYFLTLARDGSQHGLEAARAFREGIAAYEAGDRAAAASAFERAIRSDAFYAEAWAWRGRVAFEGRDYDEAQRYYENASRLAPANETYRWFARESARLGDG